MPVAYAIDVAGNTVRTRCAGMVTLQEVIEHFRVLEQDPQCPPAPDVFLDLTDMDMRSVPQSLQVSRVVLEVKRIRGRVQFGACAIVAPHDVIFGMMRMFEAMAEQYFRATRSFRNAAEAEMWLSAQRSGPE